MQTINFSKIFTQIQIEYFQKFLLKFKSNIAFDLLIISKCMFSYIPYIYLHVLFDIYLDETYYHIIVITVAFPYYLTSDMVQIFSNVIKTIKNELYLYNQTYMYVKNSEHIFCKTHTLCWNIWTRLTC